MRIIGHFTTKQQALLFGDFLYSQGIENRAEADETEGFQIWIYDEEKLALAREMMKKFLEEPEAEEYTHSLGATKRYQRQRRIEEKSAQKRVIHLRTQWRHTSAPKMGPITITLIAVSIIVSLITRLGADPTPVQFLYITNFVIEGQYVSWSQGLPEFFDGQIWRIFTPMFLHFGILHIIFNMLWLKDLGSIVEAKHGGRYFLILVLAIAGLSNVGQFLVSGPLFGGMSGVVYGLLGYLWIRGRYDPSYGLVLNKQIVVMMIVWFFICLIGLIGHVANAAHGVGLGFGMIWGYSTSRHWKKYFK